MRQFALHQISLAFAQIGAGFQYQVTLGQAFEGCEFGQQITREPAAARADFQNRRQFVAQTLRTLAGKRSGEQASQFGGGDEIAGAAEFAGARAVIAQTGCVQCQFHEAREVDPAASGGNFAGDERGQSRAVRTRGVRRYGQK